MKLNLNKKQISECRSIAKKIGLQVQKALSQNTSVASERTFLRLLGVDQAKHISENNQFYPYANIIIDDLVKNDTISDGVLFWMANACLHFKKDPKEVSEYLVKENISLTEIKLEKRSLIEKKSKDLAKAALEKICKTRSQRDVFIKKYKDTFPKSSTHPLKYVIVASGNIFEDIVQARSAAQAGAEVIAVIRSTAQSLLDFVPHGATTEGFGGTYATQENFKIMRRALDEEGEKIGRYIRLTNYSSGLCMSEIAAIAAIERLDFLLCDSLYGILFRDINMQRTLIDQHLSRMICAVSEIYINTGEDNYLTTADAIENGHQVLASQFINERFALSANMKPQFMGLGHAMEMNPWHKDVILLEIARAQMTRDIFPEAPLKYMPPTKHMQGDVFFSHTYDAIFNFVSSLTKQGIHLVGMPTEAIHTPFLGDRYMALKSCNYIFGGSESLYNEIQYKKGGKIEKWSQKVLTDSLKLLKSIEKKGLFKSIEEKCFAEVSRSLTSGKGYNGVIQKSSDYINPLYDYLKEGKYVRK
ncbi:MAG: lysine 5,6-aminomutase subunit alpha [Oligoflexia bacterium]|nr:lysine 5,6-aminomutase subunit alpha [Oligoflexia bacterium]